MRAAPPSISSTTLNNAPAATGGGFAWVLQRGNPNLVSEVADTWTWGLVTSLANNLTLSFDWYKVEIEDAIMLYSLDLRGLPLLRRQDRDQRRGGGRAGRNAGLSADIPRDLGNGNRVERVCCPTTTRPRSTTSGMDVAWNWFKPIGQRNLGFNLQATILDYYETKQSPAPFDAETDWAGSLGPTGLSGTNPGAYDYRLLGSVNYARNDWNVALRWRHLPSVWSARVRDPAGDQEEQRQRRCRWAGYPAQLHADDRYRVGRLQRLRSVVRLGHQRHAVVARWYHELVRYRPGGGGRHRRDIPVRVRRLDPDLCSSLGSPAGLREPVRLQPARPGPVTCRSGTYNAGYYDTLGRRFFVGLSMQF